MSSEVYKFHKALGRLKKSLNGTCYGHEEDWESTEKREYSPSETDHAIARHDLDAAVRACECHKARANIRAMLMLKQKRAL